MIFKSRNRIIFYISPLLLIFILFFIFSGQCENASAFKARISGASSFGSSGFGSIGGIKLPDQKITIEGNDIPLRPLIIGICHEFRLNYVLSSSVNGSATLHIRNIPLPNALLIILRAGNLGYSVNKGILLIGPRSSLKNSYIYYKINLKYIQAKNVLTDLTPVLPEGAKAYASPHGNSIFVYDIPSNIKKIKNIIRKIDVKKRVVLLNARIVDVTDNFVRNLGIAWSFSPNNNNTIISTSTFPTGFSGATTSTAGSNTLNLSVGTAWQNFGILSAQLSLGQQLGWDKVIASPSVSVISGQPATINSGVTLYYVAYTASGGASSSTPSSGTGTPSGGTTVITQEPVTSSLQTITLGLTLTVTPIVESKNSIMLNINVTNSQPDFGQEVNGFPSVNNKSVSTTVMVKNNSTLVIGGILYTDKSHSNNGIPILSTLPVIGYLFSSRQRSVSKEQLMVFISPKIVN